MNYRRMLNDLSRAAGPMLAGWVLLEVGPWIAQVIGRGEVSLWLTSSAAMLFCAGLTHILRRIWFPYVELSKLFHFGMGHPVGDGLKALGVCFVIGCALLAFSNVAKADVDGKSTYRTDTSTKRPASGHIQLPGQAEALIPTLRNEVDAHWPDHYNPAVFAAQVEQESRWNPAARLHTAREDGYGLGQFTVTPRFNAIRNTIAAHPRELAGWGVDNVMEPRYQLRALVLLNRDAWRGIVGAATRDDHMAFTLAAYNGGPGSVAKRRAICRGVAGCDADKWWGHAERHAPQAKTAAAGYGRSFADINTEYPRLIMVTRLPKYLGRM